MLVPKKETIRIADDIDVVVPASNNLMTPFVLKEQKDWFEEEIKFIRKFLKPHMNVIDIGANYGLYTLSSAKKIGDKGKLWAFEPTGSVAECLRESIKANNFNNITLLKAGLSNHDGEANLSLNPNAELNSLNTPVDENSKFETIELKTLDSSMNEFEWDSIDFVKLDAEGEEVRILEGGKSFFDQLSPVIMYELKHGDQVNLSLINKFDEFDYKSYYLIPGPMILVPFSVDMDMDSFQLNLFAMKDETAKRLSEEGFLVFETDHFDEEIEKGSWIEYLRSKKFSTGLIDRWLQYVNENSDDLSVMSYVEALDLFTYSHDTNNTNELRLRALFKSASILKELVSETNSLPISTMCTRVYFEIGKRAEAVTLLGKLINQLTKGEGISLALPFFPPLKRYEDMDISKSVANWLFSSLLEPFELKKAFSSYFSGKQSLGNLVSLKKLEFCSNEIDRRIDLLQSI